MTEDKSHKYTTDDVNRIIRRALKIEQSESISHQDLLETARELGIDPSKIEDAIKHEASAMEKEKLRNEYLNHRRERLKYRIWRFISINMVVFIINCITPGPWYFQWVLLGTGISLSIGLRKTFFATEYQIEKGTYRYENRKAKLRRRHNRAVEY